jgi:hypothetical protein
MYEYMHVQVYMWKKIWAASRGDTEEKLFTFGQAYHEVVVAASYNPKGNLDQWVVAGQLNSSSLKHQRCFTQNSLLQRVCSRTSMDFKAIQWHCK